MSTNTDLENILGLLAMTIFADKKILAAEIKAFVRAVRYLQAEQVISTDMSEADTINWYEAHKVELKALVTGKEFEPWINEVLVSLKGFPGKSALLVAMSDIANSDEEVHVSELALVTIVAKHWGLAA